MRRDDHVGLLAADEPAQPALAGGGQRQRADRRARAVRG